MTDRITIAWICFLTGVLNCFNSIAIAKHSSLKIEPSTVEMGILTIGKKVMLEADIVNHGSKPVKIKKVKASCGCLVRCYNRICPAC